MDNTEKLEALRTRLFTAPSDPDAEVSINADLAYWLINSAEACKSWLDKTAWVQEHASTFGTPAIGKHVADVMTDEIHRARGEADSWYKACQGLESLVKDIGAILGADMPLEQVTAACRRRMEELARASSRQPTTAEINLALALGTAQGTLRALATVSKDPFVVKKAWAAVQEIDEVFKQKESKP